MSTSRLLIALAACAMAVWAQPTSGVTGPVTGFIFGAAAGDIRPMLGIPGAAYLGLEMARGLETASIAPDGAMALGSARRTGVLMLYTGLRTASPKSVRVTGGISAADRFAWAPDGASAAVYSPRGEAQILTGLATTPVVSSVALGNLPRPVTALAFDGKYLIIGVSGDAGGIYLASVSSAPQRIAQSANLSAIALAGSSLYFTDNQAQEIWHVQSYAANPAAMVFSSNGDLSAPAAIAVSKDAQRLFVANAGSRKLVAYDMASRAPLQTIDLAFTPTRLDRFGDDAAFLMNDAGPREPVYVLRDGGTGKAAVFFVPAASTHLPARR